ncbi:electron transport complex subunit E [candidate division NPL-UPA2 bacterium]|nr:electron transport complex subunit E [candidate division NPL-UPA2 bacterium]
MTNFLVKGLWKENPIFRLVLGICPTLAVTTQAINGVGMGLATTVVLVCSNLVISALRKFIPPRVRIPSFIVIIASFVSIVNMIMEGFYFELHKELGLFIPLIVVNCIILGRAEAFASRNPVLSSLADGLGMGIGFTLSLIVLGSIREILGAGTILGVSLFGEGYLPFLIMILPPGAFISLGLLLGLMNRISKERSN